MTQRQEQGPEKVELGLQPHTGSAGSYLPLQEELNITYTVRQLACPPDLSQTLL